ncbi:hypothetical protein BHMPCIPO_02716 [Ensifer sesbaniae]|jgi:hypothetical protein|nr:hypothetical protein [Ensifer sesbaniae]
MQQFNVLKRALRKTGGVVGQAALPKAFFALFPPIG